MRIFRVVLFIACALFALPAKSAQLPFLRGPLAYFGEYGQKETMCRIFLYLGRENTFLLQEKTPNSAGEPSLREYSGTWHQIRNRAFVQLSNNSLRQLLAVGAAGALYLGVQVADEREGGKHIAVVLRQQNSALHAKEIQSIPPKEREPGYTPGYFLDAVAGSRWKLTRIGRDPVEETVVASFFPDTGTYSGKLKFFDKGRLIFGTFSLEGERLSLAVSDAGETFSRLAEQVRFWQLAGDILELWDDKQIVALLEKAR